MSAPTVTLIEHEIGASGQLALHLRSTDTTLRGVAGGSVRVRARGDRALDGLDVERGPGELTIRARSGRVPDLEIDVPFGAAISADGASSDIEAHGLHGDQRYRTASGDLRLRDVQGSLTVEAVSGDVDIVAEGRASILARTVSGELSLRAGSLAALRVTTTSGDIRVAARFDGPGPFGIDTVSGDATVAPANGVRIAASTITGDVRSDVPSRAEGSSGRRSLVIGDGGATIAFRSMSGDLHIVGPSPAAPPEPPDSPEPPMLAGSDPDPEASLEVDRLDILRALERGDIDIEEAGRRLAALDDRAQQLETDHG